ncbi:COP9 signalosome complex subunit 4-like [Schistocerca gregaria]|uniref:COP9 signalosome complex subunit 4-like n=1 Tax=Schistocerca gregaria TaxID=7010 RepID=UPI00211E85B3|nr:COP9 signalosome complex subunit 4-like [Schistocerca gregaria]
MIEARLREIEAIRTQKSKIEEYIKLLEELFEHKQLDFLKVFVTHIISSSTASAVCHVIFQEFSKNMPRLPSELHIELANYTIENTRSRSSAFEDEIAKIRENLAAVYESREQWLKAAKTLAELPLEHGGRGLDTHYLIDKYVKIARNFLEIEYPEAERYLTKAAALIQSCTDPSLISSCEACIARNHEVKQRFSEAATHYHKLAGMLTEESDRENALENAIICAIMARAGPSRSRQLGVLYKDERSVGLKLYPILQKMFTDRILRKQEVDNFVALLKMKPNFAKNMTNTMPALDKAIREHNLLSASKIYLSISFDELALLLDVSAEQAEKLAATMIGEDRLQGNIDQIERTINFENFDVSKLWGVRIELTCLCANKILEMITTKHPGFTETMSGHRLE